MEKSKTQKDIFIPCDCHTHGIQIAEVDCDDGWFEICITPYFLVSGDNLNIWERIKGAYSVLFHGRWMSHEWIDIASPEYAQQIINYFNKFVDKAHKAQWGRISDWHEEGTIEEN